MADWTTAPPPAWEAVYEPGNVSPCLIGYVNDEISAKAAAEAWHRMDDDGDDEPRRTEWIPQWTRPESDYDQWFELVERCAEGFALTTNVIVRHHRHT